MQRFLRKTFRPLFSTLLQVIGILFYNGFQKPLVLSKTNSSKFSFSKLLRFYLKLGWEPSASHVAKNYSRRLPALERFYRESKFSLLKSTHSTKNLKTKLRTFPFVSWVSQSKFWANRSRGFWVMIGQTNRQL